ncbi:MAG: FAD-dependent oxidoreductase [Verrucomicrobiota bacterium]
MNRRSLIKYLAASALGLPMRSEAAKSESILIVGAGMAGISAARSLHDAGYKVTILEGRDRLGGRLWTSRKWKDAPVDLGASWIHGVRGNPLTKLADEISAPRVASDSDNWPLYDAGGQKLPGRTWNPIEKFEGQIRAAIRKANQEDRDISIGAAMTKHMDLKALNASDRRQLNFVANNFIEQEWASDVDELSSWHIDEGKDFGGDDVIFPKGYDDLAHHLAKGLEIRLGEKVSAVSMRKDGVTVSTASGELEADRVVVTLPIGVLKSGAVKFEPGLPKRKQAAVDALGCGVMNKLHLRFPKVFWQSTADWISYLSEEKGVFSAWFNQQRASKTPILTAFNSGRFGRAIEDWSDDKIVDEAMRTLQLMYGSKIPDPEAAQITRWASDPFALCSYSSPAVGMTKRSRDDLAEPISDRILFAGEATNADYPSTVHGAFLSGQREAKRIAKFR